MSELTESTTTETTKETFEQFCERMAKVEKTDEFVVGRASSGNTRAIFQFEESHCHLESRGFRCLPQRKFGQVTPAQMLWVASAEPYDYWVHCRLIYGKDRAKRMMKHYKAKSFEEDPYPREEGVWFYLNFSTFEDLMTIVWDIHTGKFKELWGDEPKEYQSCIGYLEDSQS